LAASRIFRRYMYSIERISGQSALVDRWSHVLRAILLVEMLERPFWMRLIERTSSVFPGVGARSVGPFQMAASPFRFDAAVKDAAERLECHFGRVDPTLDEIALYWNGAASRQPGAAMSYRLALEISTRVLLAV